MTLNTSSGAPDPDEQPYLFDTEQAARFLNVAPITMRKWRSQGRGPAYVHISSRSVRYRVEDLKAWADGLLVGGGRR